MIFPQIALWFPTWLFGPGCRANVLPQTSFSRRRSSANNCVRCGGLLSRCGLVSLVTRPRNDGGGSRQEGAAQLLAGQQLRPRAAKDHPALVEQVGAAVPPLRPAGAPPRGGRRPPPPA